MRSVCLFPLLLAALFPVLAVAQPVEGFYTGVPEPKPVGMAGSASVGDNAVELPYSQVFRDTEPPYGRFFRDLRVGGQNTAKIGSADALFESHLFEGLKFRGPLYEKFEPKDAQLRLGPFWLSVDSVSASLLFSDNVNLTETDREDGIIGIMRLRVVAMLQLGDKLQVRMMGTLVYLPFEGEIGVAGFGIGDPVVYFMEPQPLGAVQLTYDTQVGGWDVEFVEELGARYRRFGAQFGFDMFSGARFDEEDRAGRYVFKDTTRAASGLPFGSANGFSARSGDYIEARNLVGATVSRLLPTETKLEFGAYHADYAYTFHEGRLPTSRDSAFVMLVSEREAMRFQPFVAYQVSKYDYQPSWVQEAHGGLSGPVTENLRFLGQFGYYVGEKTVPLWKVRLRHTPHERAYQEIEFRRGLTEPDLATEELLGYRFTYLFRNDLVANFYATRAIYYALNSFTASGEEDRLGLRFTYDLAQRTTLQVGAAYERITYDSPRFFDSKTWIARALLRHRYTKWLEAWLTYQYHDRNASGIGNSYFENLLMLTVIRYF